VTTHATSPVEATSDDDEPLLNGHKVRSQKSTRLLLRAAGDLVAEGGYQSMTLATVGERAGYSRSLATARFGSKGKLLEALVEEIVVRWDVQTVEPQTQGLTGLEALRVLLNGIKDAYARDPRSLSILYALIFEAVGPVPELHDRFVAFHMNQRKRIATYLRNGVEDGSIRAGVDPELQAALIVAQLRGVGYLWKLDPDTIDAGAVLASFIDQVCRDVEAHTGQPQRRKAAARKS
jgi:AcrR family transcriptional regulator